MVEGQFRAPPKLDNAVLPLVQLPGIIAAKLRKHLRYRLVRTVPQAALLPATICLQFRINPLWEQRSSEISIFWEQDLLR